MRRMRVGWCLLLFAGCGDPVQSLAVEPTSCRFWQRGGGLPSAGVTFTVRTTGGGTTGPLSSTLGGAQPEAYMITNDGCDGMRLSQDDELHGDGRHVADDPRGRAGIAQCGWGPRMLRGGFADGDRVGPTLTIVPGSKDFGSIDEGTSSTEQLFTVQNAGSAPTGTLSVSVSGTDAAQFAITTDTCTGSTWRRSC